MKANLQVTLHGAPAEAALNVRSLTMTDGLSRPFEIELELLSPDYDLDYAKLMGAGLGVHVERPDGRQRDFHGIVTHLDLAGSTERFAVYRATLRPWLWLLGQSFDDRIFQDQSVVDIVRDGVCRKRGFDDVDLQLTATYAKRPYCVQYGESDLDFVQRLLEEEGIRYWFRHQRDKHVLVLADSMQGHEPPKGAAVLEYRPHGAPEVDAQQGITRWQEQRDVVPGAVVVGSHNFMKPTKPRIQARANAPAKQQHAGLEQYAYGSGVREVADAESRARLVRESLQGAQRCFVGSGNVFELALGHRYTLTRHRRAALNQEYLLTGATHRLVSAEAELGSYERAPAFTLASDYNATTTAETWRPPRVTRKPSMRGPQTAIVRGPGHNELHTDKYGRVKLKFHWDREGSDDDKASCWVRVSQGSAGKGWGQMVLPRVGEEVIVDFLNGDPDQPIVTGRVYNAANMPPYALPEHRTRSTWKSHSTPSDDDEAYNELRFEDKVGHEEIYLHAERDFVRVVENNDSLRVGFDKKDDGSQTVAVWNSQTVEVGASGCKDGSQTVKVWKNRSTEIATGDDALTVKRGDSRVKIEAGSHTLEAQTSITFKVGPNSITIDQGGVTVKALQVKVEGQTSVQVEGLQVAVKAKTALDLSALLTNVDSKALLVMKGGLVQIN